MKHLKLIFAVVILIVSYSLAAQVAITTDGSSADASSILDVKSIDKGMLIPQIALTGVYDVETIAAPATSLLIYNTATVTGITPGYYYNTGTVDAPVWTRLATGTIDGSETKVNAGTNVTVTGTGTTASPYVVNATTGGDSFIHYIGELYGGGIIISVWKENGTEHGLIASLIDLSSYIAWTTKDYQEIEVPGATNLMNGLVNTNAIVAQAGPGTNYAAGLCSAYINSETGTGVYTDWYLPAAWELIQCMNAAFVVNNVLAADIQLIRYWSSTGVFYNAMALDFYIGTMSTYGKNRGNFVRAVRRY